MTQTELDRKAEILAIELTEEETKAAILEGKIKKWWHQRNAEYWDFAEFKNHHKSGMMLPHNSKLEL